MADFVLSCCSAVDLSRERLEERNIPFACFHYELGDRSYPDDMGLSMALPEFYRRMTEGEMTRTSQIGITEYEQFWEPFLASGNDVLHITLSSGISGSYNSALIAANEMREKYPERKLFVVDSMAASGGYGLFVEEVADRRDEGMSIEETAAWAEEHRLECIHWFFSSDLTFFIRGGRISKTAGTFGQLLNICPLMDVDPEGKLEVRYKIRTKKKVIRETIKHMEEDVLNGKEYDGRCYITQAACYDDARAVADLIEKTFPKLAGKVEIFDIGTTIGSHTGPGTVALFFWGNRARARE